ncbi:MAG: alpha/beta hydrolase-fold protein [Lacisediminihabitans sp.]
MFDPLWHVSLRDGAFPIIAGVIGVMAAGILAVIITHRSRGHGHYSRTIALLGGGVVILLSTAVGVNTVTGSFATIGSLVGKTVLPSLTLPALTSGPSPSNWDAPSHLLPQGHYGVVEIPATASRFKHREDVVYLPPAALAPHPPKLPVLIMLSGQPGVPMNMVTSVDIPSILDHYARAHRGLAPIVVIPDQLGAPYANPMCVDSPLGRSATYLSVDVPAWIRSHLNVSADRQDWAIGGYSQGGTCSIQLGSRFTATFGNILDISGELAPHRGSVASTVKDAFGGSTAAYEAAKPLNLLASHAPFADTLAIFAVGERDKRYRPIETTMREAAARAGMNTVEIVAPNSAHDWKTVGYAIDRAIAVLGQRWAFPWR